VRGWSLFLQGYRVPVKLLRYESGAAGRGVRGLVEKGENGRRETGARSGLGAGDSEEMDRE
jgi:hypothetical protein